MFSPIFLYRQIRALRRMVADYGDYIAQEKTVDRHPLAHDSESLLVGLSSGPDHRRSSPTRERAEPAQAAYAEGDANERKREREREREAERNPSSKLRVCIC